LRVNCLASAAPACAHGRGCRDETNFGAGWAGSGHTLSTLRPVGRPTRTQDSLPAVGQTLPGGLQAHWVPPKGFFDALTSLSSFPRLSLAQARSGPTQPKSIRSITPPYSRQARTPSPRNRGRAILRAGGVCLDSALLLVV